MNRQLEETVRRSLDALAPDADTLDRIVARVRGDVARDAAPTIPVRPRRRRMRGIVVPASLGATAVVAAIALGPSSEDASIPRPLSAAAAFTQAGDAAESAPWSPLAAGEYHHTYTLDLFTPQGPWQDLDAVPYVDHEQYVPSATEAWIDRNGHGRHVSITGLRAGVDDYMQLSRNRHGHITGGGWSTNDVDDLSIRERLRHADQVGTLAWNGEESGPVHTHWYRQPDEYVSSRLPGWQGYVPTSAKGTTAEKIQTWTWGKPIAWFDRVNQLEGAELDEALLPLLASGPVPGQSEYELGDTFGASAGVIATEERILRAVQLLGAAPLSPDARAALFRWLGEQDAARVERDAEDALGRSGTRVTFLAEHGSLVPARTWTIDEIVAQAKGNGQPVIGRLDAKPTYEVAAHRQYRQWYVDVVFDHESGQLLQQASHVKWGTHGGHPQLTWSGDGPNTVTRVTIKPEAGVVGSATAYLKVDRTTDFTAASPVCRAHPHVCR